MKKALLSFIIGSLIATSLPVYADFSVEADDVLIYEEPSLQISMPEIDEFSLFDTDQTEMEVVTISTADELIAFRDKVNSDSEYTKNKLFKLTNSIDLGGIEWEPIGYNSSYQIGDDLNMLRDYSFSGIFDGQGNTISNFKMSDSDYTYMGFFGTIHLGTVRNLNIADAYIDYTGSTDSQIPQFTGLLAAFSNYAEISDCNVSGDINIKNTTAYATGTTVCTGMLSGVGLAKVDNCTASGSISVNTLTPPYVGGLWGFATTAAADFDSYINNCVSEVSIDVDSISGISAGGIIGRGSQSLDEISGCSYAVDSASSITATHTYTELDTGSASLFLGGIAGVNNSNLENCSVGDIMITAIAESSPTVGGIAGKNEGVINACSTKADITVDLNRSSYYAPASTSVGGVSGSNGGSHNSTSDPAPADFVPVIKNCKITSDVAIDINSESGSSTVCGFITGLAFAPSEIENCSSYASDMKITSKNAGTYAGGICGLLNGAATRYCYSSGDFGDNISSATSTYIGGIAGDANLKYFYSYDTSFGVENPLFIKTYFYGGVIEDCASDMNINISNSPRIYAGGIVGYLTKNYTEDNVTYHINANRDLSVARCTAKGNITVTPDITTFAGGAIGYSVDGKVYDTYSTGNISATKDVSSSYLGGFVGVVFQNRHDYDQPVASLDNCYSTGKIIVPESSSKLKSGDFAAQIVQSPTTQVFPKLTGCYYLKNSAQDSYSGISSLSPEELTDTNSFNDWDFDNIWTMSDNGPVLKYENTLIYGYNNEDGYITSLLISKPYNNSKLFAVTYDNEKVTNVQEYDVSAQNNEYFIAIPCNIQASDNIKLFIWGGNDCMQPLSDAYISADLK